MGIPATLSSVPATTPYIQYVATSGQTVFPYPFVITQDSDLVVVDNGVTYDTDAGYTVSGVGNPTGGNVTLNTGATAGDIVTLYRNIPIERLTQFAQNGGFSSTAFNAEFNNVYLLLQQLQTSIDQCLQIPNTNNPAPTVSLTPGSYANKYLAFDGNGNPTPAVLTVNGTITQGTIAGLLYPQTAAEAAASVTPVNLQWLPGRAPRYGVVGNGIADDTTAMQAMLSCSKDAVVPFGFTPLVSSGLTVAAECSLTFEGGYGYVNNGPPGSYVKVASSMTSGNVITLMGGSVMKGGGVVGASANTGDGIVIAGNGAELYRPFVQGMGGDGIRVGTSGGANCNCFRIIRPVVVNCSGKGISIHDGNGIQNANCNAGHIDSPFTTGNGSHGLYLGHCWWVLVTNVCSESNTGYGVYCDGANDTGSVPICRFPTFVGGDANEGNTAGQWYDQSYFGTFINPDDQNVPTTAVGALAGSGERNVHTPRASSIYGLTVNTVDAAYPCTVSDGHNGGMTYPLLLSKQTTASNGDGIGLAALLNNGSSTVQAGGIRWQQAASGQYNWVISGYGSGGAVDMLVGNANASAVEPAADNTFACGASGLRWNVVYAATGTINTSDGRQKQDVAPLSDAERRVAIRIKSLVRTFRFKDAVAKKGNGARTHVGVVAQDVADAFRAEGLDPAGYGLFCYDQWKDKDGNTRDAYGVRYEELLAFMVSAL